jgi:hypothetical protein
MAIGNRQSAIGNDQRVVGGGAGRDGSNRQAGGQLGGKVLEAMDREIDIPPQEGILQFLREEALPADLGQGFLGVAVAAGGDADQLIGEAGAGRDEGLGDPGRLRQGEGAAAGSDGDSRFWIFDSRLPLNVGAPQGCRWTQERRDEPGKWAT